MMLRWKRDGARHTARFIGVIWFSSTEDVTSFRKHSSVCRTSRFSSAISMMAARTACKRCSLGTSGWKERAVLSMRVIWKIHQTRTFPRTRRAWVRFPGYLKLENIWKMRLTLVYVKKGFSHLAGEERFRQISEELFNHVGHVIRRLVLVADVFRRAFTHLPQSMNARLHARFAEKADLKQNKRFWQLERLNLIIDKHAVVNEIVYLV